MLNKLNNTGLRAFLGFTLFALALKAVLDLVVWRYAGPISLVIVLSCIGLYLRHRKRDLSVLGIVPLKTAKNFWLLPVQTLIAILVIIATGAGVSLLGDASGLEFMQPNPEGPRSRFGDLAGNTPLFLFWLAILWVAGPAEELFFRGFMINSLTEAFGKSRFATVMSILIPALIFGAGHVYYQGIRGLFTTGAIGLSLGCLFLAYRRNIWPLMVSHACVNSLVFTLHYLDMDA